MTRMEKTLEDRCHKLTSQKNNESPADQNVFLEREMALTLDHLDRSRNTKESLLQKIDNVGDAVDNRLLNMRRLPNEYSPRLWIERDHIRNQLRNTQVRIESDRRRICMDTNKEVQRLQDRLLDLWNKHQLLHLNNGDQQDYS